MGKRLNVFVSEKAYDILVKFQRNNKIPNRDMALDKFILDHDT